MTLVYFQSMDSDFQFLFFIHLGISASDIYKSNLGGAECYTREKNKIMYTCKLLQVKAPKIYYKIPKKKRERSAPRQTSAPIAEKENAAIHIRI